MNERAHIKALHKGVVLVDKPSGPTSHDTVQMVKKKLDVPKAGHVGTLDPKVTGVMLITLNEATKAVPVLMGLDKEYEGTMHIHDDFDEAELRKTMKYFVGKITQLPPVRSAVARRLREREVYSFEILEIRGKDITFRTRCQAGTYVRKLVSDLGEKLGINAHMTSLRRTSIDDFKIKECKTIEKLKEKDVIPLEKILKRVKLQEVSIDNEQYQKIKHGAPIENKSKVTQGVVGLYYDNQIVALANVNESKIMPDRVFKT
ncbi:MAG: RNA-guided pseudouridylation complex pseudouridine synthase subunit Cbf5 [Nanoarchaeota archaeon]|nr:RNA-guided pseudouridylation complex pseudouridine synthase subunit Cbf5 [Nanoarchaeota archaeon]MBU1135124.1 RNA-guided pseudouridylation complex pseudouridine synthase subunit Cbf5 [Nanoarchaeota archaeon]MBU2520134.1 RNA-guided pseudouridylation complex pseudouridine synthase subunit Cbf5 [Nanoarchaeota archaeon]